MTAYLARLGLDERPPATVETLTAIHQRHIEQIPYENLGAVLGAAPDIDAATTLARVAAGGNAGYCFHHNGLLTLVLRELGFNVVPAWGYPWGSEEGRRDRRVEHLALTVRGLPTDENPGGIWYPDVGCGDGIHAPLPWSPASTDRARSPTAWKCATASGRSSTTPRAATPARRSSTRSSHPARRRRRTTA
nr:hypothetical protein GCM10025730_23760 [Promicromonospora thailandica]